MDSVYLDTNFFIYIGDKSSPFCKACTNLVRYCKKNDVPLSTSAETMQEIIHLSKNTKQLFQGIKLAKTTLRLVDEVLPVNKTTIELYLDKVKIYPPATSRDLIHLATCIENKIDIIVTFDSDFKKFKEVRVFKPEEFLKQAEHPL